MTALLFIERALNGTGTWRAAHAEIVRAVADPVDAGTHAGLLYGAPALAFTLHAARADGRPRYEKALAELTGHVERITYQRLAAAHERIASGNPGPFGEYDLLHGLTGLGVVLLRVAPESDALESVLRYLTTLTRPLTSDDLELPGWWADHDPDPLTPTPGGHANLGLAHGAAGILAFLSLARLSGLVVGGQDDAIADLQAWYDQWRQDGDDGPWWPQVLTRDDLRTGRPTQARPGRPSWCYGTPARALQLAALATGDKERQAEAEHALATSLSPRRLSLLSDTSLCHGLAGTYQTAFRAARDAITPAIAERLPHLAAALETRAAAPATTGFLTGSAGTRLALETVRHGTPRSGWDSCLLLA